MGPVEGGTSCRMAVFNAARMAEIIFVLLLVLLSPLSAKPGAKPLAKSDPGHLVHDFYKCTGPVYRLSPECQQQQQQPAPQFASGRIFSESQHFVEGGGRGQNPHQAAQNNWPSYGSNTGERKNERMVMPSAVEEESLRRRIHDDEQTTTSVVEADHTVEEERNSTVERVELGDISHHDKKNLVQQSYQGVQGVSASVYDETTTKNPDSTHHMGFEVNDTEGDNVDEDNAGQLFMDIRNRAAAADLTDSQEQESGVWPSASYTSISLTPSIAHLPLENQEVTLTQDLGGSQLDTSNLGHLPLENQDYDMLEQNPNVTHLQPETHTEVEEEMVDLSGPLPEKDFAAEESPSVYDPIILMLQRP